MITKSSLGFLSLAMSKIAPATMLVIAVPSVVYAVIALAVSAIKNLPNAALLPVGFVLSPVYLVLFVEEKFGLKKLALVIDEKRVATWPEILVVVLVFSFILWWFDASFFKEGHALSFRVICSCAGFAGLCVVSFFGLMLLK